MKIRSLKLQDRQFGNAWHEVVEDHWNYADFLQDDGWRRDWISFDGVVYQATPNGNISVYVEGMGVATGIAFDDERNMYVGDRSGTIFKISPERQIFVFATIEPSIAAYHLAFGPDQYLYVSGPTTSSFDCSLAFCGLKLLRR